MKACTEVVCFFLLVLLVSLLPGCGGGGGAGNVPAPFSTNTVVIKTLGAPATLYGVQFKVELPDGVTLAADQFGALTAGAMVPSGGAAGASLVTDYQASASYRSVTVSLVKASGFPVGEFLTVNALVPLGTSLSPGDFILSDFKAYDNLATGGVATAVTGGVSAP